MDSLFSPQRHQASYNIPTEYLCTVCITDVILTLIEPSVKQSQDFCSGPPYGLSKLLGVQPLSQSSSAILDVTSPVKLVVKICYRTRFQASSGNSDSMNRPGYEAAWSAFRISFTLDWQIDNGFLTGQS